jgi:MerR family mercuric resistance operon transcriptional regulator
VLRIGAVAAAAGLTVDAVRYYERLGLLPAPPRTTGRFRIYSSDTIARLRFIRQAKGLGLELREIGDLLAPANGRRRQQCQRVRATLARHLSDVDSKLRELQSFRRTLRGALDDCDRALRSNENIGCPVVEHLGRHEK